MNTTRRTFLGGLAVASALASTSIAADPARTSEDAGLLALGKLFEEAHQRFLQAAESLPVAQAAYRAIAPCGDGVLFEEHQGPRKFASELYHDPASPTFVIMKSERGFRMWKVCPLQLTRMVKEGYIAERDIALIHARAVQFEQAQETAERSSGLASALENYRSAEFSLRDVVGQIVALRATTLAGVGLKVRATAAYAVLGTSERHTASLWLANAVWSDLGEAS